MNNKIFLIVIFKDDDFKTIINNIIFQVHKDFQCIFLINNEKKYLYDKINDYLKLFNLDLLESFASSGLQRLHFRGNPSRDPLNREKVCLDTELIIPPDNESVVKLIKIDNNINPIKYGINIFLKSNCSYFTWIYNNYIFDSFFLYNLIQIKASFCYTSFKINNVTHVNKKYDNLNNLLFDSNFMLKSFMWDKNTIQQINDSEYNNSDDYKISCLDTTDTINEQLILNNLYYYDIFYITFKLVNIDQIKYLNKVLLEIKEEKEEINMLTNSVKYNFYKKYCLKYHNVIDNNLIYLHKPKKEIINLNNKNNIIITFSSIPSRFLDINFEDTLISLYNQIIKPKYIILNLCKKYKRFDFVDNDKIEIKVNFLKEKYNSLIIQFVEDYGPITKLLGLINLNEIIKPDDKIIIVDDDWKYIDTLTYYYNLVYELYDCDAVFINENELINWDEWWEKKECNKKQNIIYENYNGLVFGWLSYSIKYMYIDKLLEYYKYIVSINEDMWLYDNLIISMFYKKIKIKSCGLNIFLLHKQISLLDTIDPLRKINNINNINNNFKKELEKKILNINFIEPSNSRKFFSCINPNKIIHGPSFAVPSETVSSETVPSFAVSSETVSSETVDSKINIEKKFLCNIKNISLKEENNTADPRSLRKTPNKLNETPNISCPFKSGDDSKIVYLESPDESSIINDSINIININYFNEKIFILTVFFNNINSIYEYKILINNNEEKIIIENNNLLNKNTFFIKIENYNNLQYL